MDVDELKTLLSEIKTDVKARIGELASLEKLRQLESQIVGKKGRLGELLGSIGKFPKEARGSVGQVLNSAKKEVAELFQTRRTALQASESAADSKAGVATGATAVISALAGLNWNMPKANIVAIAAMATSNASPKDCPILVFIYSYLLVLAYLKRRLLR